MPNYPKVTVIGVGLIGGSIGLALKERGLADEVVGVGRRQESLDRALQRGAISSATTELPAGVENASAVIVATPVASVVGDVGRALEAAPPHAWVTDVGSTKASICASIADHANAGAAANFVGSHPLAGDHRSGPEHARGDLFEGKVVVITPTLATPASIVEQAEGFWESLGARVVRLAPEEHDQALATTSHLPHLVASALASTTPTKWLPLAASGWADTTRVAAADPELWAQIFAQNTPDVVAALDRLIEKLQTARAGLLAEDRSPIKEILEHAKRTRDALGN
jgi:prephenate dehydrogenase